MQNKEIINTVPQAILDSKDLKQIAKLHFPGAELLCSVIIRLLKFHKLNEIYKAYSGPGGLHFVEYAIKSLKLKYEVNTDALQNIPQNGAFVTISNHPYGGADGIGIFYMLLPIRPDYKTVSNYMMTRLKPLQDNFFTVNPFISGRSVTMNITGIKDSMQHLKEGHPLGLFPAGEVSSYNNDYPGICDKKWDKSIMRLVQKANVPVVPIYFHGTNSKMFHLLGRMSPFLRTAKIPSELLNKHKRTIKISIGKPIDIETQKSFLTIEDYIDFLRQQTYTLAHNED
jgi:putative hemolysin